MARIARTWRKNSRTSSRGFARWRTSAMSIYPPPSQKNISAINRLRAISNPITGRDFAFALAPITQQEDSARFVWERDRDVFAADFPHGVVRPDCFAADAGGAHHLAATAGH